MGFFDALIQHFHYYVVVVVEFNHQFLRVLHGSERIVVYEVSVVKEQVVLAGQLDSDFLSRMAFALDEHFCSDGFQSAYFLRRRVFILDSKFKGNFSIIDDSVSLS